MVISRDEARQMTAVKPVTELFLNPNKEIYSVTLDATDGQSETIGATAEHPFYVDDKGWVEASDLVEGDQVVRYDNGDGQAGFLLVKSVVLEDARQDTYNFEVADTHTYFVGKLNAWVHNTCEAADSIANGHAQAHLDEFADLGVETTDDLADLVNETVSSPTHSNTLSDGRSFSYNEHNNVLVIVDPNHADGGTIFSPHRGLDFVLELE